MTVLVTGAHGQLGRELVDVFDDRAVVGASRSDLDVTDRDAVLSVIDRVRPDVVVNAAAWTAVDLCESDPERAQSCNATAVAHLAEGCERTGARLCQVSTDYVFDGTKSSPYVEHDVPHPSSVYGRTKLAGERAAGPAALIVRTSWVIGRHGPNFARTVLRLADEGAPLRFVDDQRGQPTVASDLAVMIRRLVLERRHGLVHVTNHGAVTWFELAREVLRLAGADPSIVQPISTAELGRPAPRPANSVLDNAALRGWGIEPLGDFRGPLREVVSALM
jgi:dTDP-4-dehydrorhamnose reductase